MYTHGHRYRPPNSRWKWGVGVPGFRSILFEAPESVAVDDDFLTPDSAVDLHLDRVAASLFDEFAEHNLAQFFRMPLRDPSAVHYRHEVFADLYRADVRAPFDAFAAGMKIVRERQVHAEKLFHERQRQRWLLDAVDAYCRTVLALQRDLADTDIRSRGLINFESYIFEFVAGPQFQQLVEETNRLQAELGKIRYTVHIVDDEVHVDRYVGQTDFAVEVEQVFARFVGPKQPDAFEEKVGWPGMNSVEERVLDCVATLYPQIFTLLDDYCRTYAGYQDTTVLAFEREVRFYLTYLTYIERFTEAGLEFCYPEVTEIFEDVYAYDAFDLALADRLLAAESPVVCNDFELSGLERILVVTGPNQSGKTAFARMVGQLCYLAALGVPVPGRQARLLLVDRVCTNFERKESLSTLHGRLDEELVRVHGILSRITHRSLVVMNESFASTTDNDALAIGVEVIERIADSRAIAVYVTFLDELASVNTATVSMVGGVENDDPTRRTFRFHRKPAAGLAHAEALAARYGLTYEAMVKRIQR